jgi:tetratricopeptide (TPR) repeat protein
MPLMRTLQTGWLRWQGRIALVLGRQTEALRAFERLNVLFPDDAHALASRAQIEDQRGAPARAIELQREVVTRRPAQAAGWFNLGFMLEKADRLDDARDAFAQATHLSPSLDRAWYGLGLVLIRLRRFDEAVEALRKNTELQPMSPYGWYQLARVHVDRQEPEEAARIIRHLRGFEPKVAAQLERETGLRTAPSA